ncbi:hypothetical protein LJC60_04060 [Ruminococcaceae bacterium OttesenSCG-928-D13]|nr:hypothetical protein [Ruminococcaceae bacterium OttesenSCG-928-D13]
MSDLYGPKDCTETGYGMSLLGKVVVISRASLSDEYPHQLFFCKGGFGANPNPRGRAVYGVFLSDGEYCRLNRSDVVGTLKPELLPDSARLHLSQIRPGGNPAPSSPEFFGYCFLSDGHYSSATPLKDAKEAVDYAHMQMPYQHRILVCDRNDHAVIEILEGKLEHPSWEQMEQLLRGDAPEQTGGMTMT